MGLILFLVLGGLIGWIASIITKRDEQQGIIMNIIVGIVGAFLGGFLSGVLTGADRSALEFDLGSLFWALLGAIALCMILNALTRKKPI